MMKTADPTTQSGSACTLRGLTVGAIGCLVVGGGFHYSALMLNVTNLAGWHFTIGANIMLFLMALAINPALGLMSRRWMLTPAELTQVYVMWIVGSAVAMTGFVSFYVPQITTLAYYASPENRWAELIMPHVPDWVIPSKDAAAVRDFYEGRADGAVPWGLWLPVFLRWAPLVTSLYVAMISLVVILRRQWVDNERLPYPMMQLPIAMVQDDETGAPRLIKPLFRNWIFWLGFALSFLIGMNNGLARYFPLTPFYLGGFYLNVFGDTVRIYLYVSFMMVGFAYLIRRDVTMGICFFYVMYLVYQIVAALQGGGRTDPLMSPFSRTPTDLAFQGVGAFIALVGVGLWSARGHLQQVARSVIGSKRGKEDGEGEIMSFRAAVIAACASLAFMAFWMWTVGLPAWIAPLYLLMAFIIYLGITRVIVEGGVPWFISPMVASDVIVGGLGTRALEPGGIVAMGFTCAWASDMIIVVMGSAANGLKVVSETVRRRRRLLLWSMLIAILVSLGSSVTTLLETAYHYGGLNLGPAQHFKDQGYYPWQDAAARLRTMTDPNWAYWGHAGLGAVAMGMLMLARQRFAWWPFHPLGFPISLAAHKIFLSILVAWVIKSAVLRYGGPHVHLALRPFFLGLIMGEWLPLGVLAVTEWLRQTL